MRVAVIVSAILAASPFVAAQKKCAADAVLQTCLRDYNARVQECAALDYICLCQAHKDILKCYVNCPDDITKGSVESSVSANCVAADAMRATMTTTAPVAKPTEEAPVDTIGSDSDSSSQTSSTSSAEDAEKTDPADSGAGALKPAFAAVVAGVVMAAAF